MTMQDGPVPQTSDHANRAAIVDLGSNSVRLVVFEGITRNPVPIFNEKATLRLGKGLQATGRLNEEGVAAAMGVLARFYAIAQSMNAAPFEVLATAAVRDASNGPDFVRAVQEQMPDVPIRVLAGEEEADYSATGVLCGLPEADGLVADIGGGSLELIRVKDGRHHEAVTLPLGVIRLSDRALGEPDAAARIVADDLAGVPWLKEVRGKPIYLVGGAFRALARLQIGRTGYPLNIVHLFELSTPEGHEMIGWLLKSARRTLEKLSIISRRRLDDVPYSATVLEGLLKAVEPKGLVFSVDGLREGWYMRKVAQSVQDEDPCLALAEEMSGRLSRSRRLAADLVDWTAPLFSGEDRAGARLRTIACLLSDIGSYDHPEYRASQAYLRILRTHGVGLDHVARAFVAMTLAIRYEADPSDALLEPSRYLLSKDLLATALKLGLTLRLAYTLCGGTATLLKGTGVRVDNDVLVLILTSEERRVLGGSVRRRLERLGAAAGLNVDMREGRAS